MDREREASIQVQQELQAGVKVHKAYGGLFGRDGKGLEMSVLANLALVAAAGEETWKNTPTNLRPSL